MDILEAGNDTGYKEKLRKKMNILRHIEMKDCTFTPTGTNPFFILEPNYQLVLAGEDEGPILR